MEENIFIGSFEKALVHLKSGLGISRTGWNGKGMYIKMQKPDEHSKMTLKYVYMLTADGILVPWICSQGDLFAEDWEVVS